MESGHGTGDHVSGWPPKQRSVGALQLQSGFHHLHLLHQSLGHPGLSQMHPDTHVSPKQHDYQIRIQKQHTLKEISPKNDISVFNYSPSCCFKPVHLQNIN